MLKLDKIGKVYRTTEVETQALKDVSLQIDAGEFVAIMGPSGCGKSTLLNILGLLDTPSAGIYEFFGENVSAYSEAQLTTVRRAAIGFVFQSFNLIDDLTVEENVEVALLYRSVPASERRARVPRRWSASASRIVRAICRSSSPAVSSSGSRWRERWCRRPR